jgi:hypothetical protein
MDILNNGNVGIGTTSPSRALDVSTTGSIAFGDNIGVANTRGLYWSSGADYSIYRTSEAWSSPNYAQLKLDWPTGIILRTARGTYGKSFVGVDDRMSIGASYHTTKSPTNGLIVQGNVGIGTTSPAAPLHVVGELRVTTTNGNSAAGNGVSMISNSNMRWTWAPGTDNWLRLYGSGMTGNEYGSYKSVAVGNLWSAGYTRFSSDDRVKHFEEEIPALEIINQLNPYKYKKTSKIYTEKYTGEIGEEGVDWVWEIGLIAQDIKKIPYLEFAVSNPEDGPEGKYGLNYTHFIGVCVQGIKEMDQKLQAEKAKVAKLELLIEGITTRMTEHERQTGFRM